LTLRSTKIVTHWHPDTSSPENSSISSSWLSAE
jgi:hypothetical protein